MSSIFEALGNFQNKKKDKKHFAKIEGKDIEVTLEQKLNIIKHGEGAFMLEDGKIILKPVSKIKSKYKKLLDAEEGYYFHDDDIHWHKAIGKGGKSWQIEYE